MSSLTPSSLAAMIDHTLLAATATEDEVRAVCEEGRRFATAAVCVNAAWVPVAAEGLDASPVAACAVAGFPWGRPGRSCGGDGTYPTGPRLGMSATRAVIAELA